MQKGEHALHWRPCGMEKLSTVRRSKHRMHSSHTRSCSQATPP